MAHTNGTTSRFSKPQAAREIEARSRARYLGVRVFEVEAGNCYYTHSQSDGGIYHVTRERSGWQCECPGYRYTGCCKHIAQVQRRSEREGWEFGQVQRLH